MRRDFQRPFALAPDATEVVLVRHGATEPAVPGEHGPLLDAQTDPRLSVAGRSQAQAVAERAAALDAAALFVTTLRRTVETARPLAQAIGSEPIVVPELREVHLGEWETTFQSRVLAGHPLTERVFDEHRWDVLPGAESMDSLAGRVAAGLRSVVETVGPGRLGIAVVHAAVIAEACRQATGSDALAFLGVENGSFTRLVHGQGGWMLRSFNDTAHLAADGAGSAVREAQRRR